jgi:predicted enzyme related to lactoylglutathione lyase
LIQGIGCIIIFANEAAKLANWYSTVLDVKTSYDPAEKLYYGALVDTATGARVEFGIRQSPEPLTGEHHAIMINYRVADLEASLGRARSQEVPVEVAVDQGSGRFAHLTDPEGNVIQLWQPMSRSGGRA